MNNEDYNDVAELNRSSYAAFNRLYTKYFDLLYGYIFRLTRSHDETKCLVQDTFLKVWVHRTEIKPDVSFKAWLFKVSKNQMIDNFRSKINNPVFENFIHYVSDENISSGPGECSLDFDYFYKCLNHAKSKLSPRQVEIFQLCKEEGLAPGKVASLLGISEQAVYNNLSKALAIIRKHLHPSQFLLFTLFFG